MYDMFKKKTNIPPRPKPPAAESLIEDLHCAPEDDIVFKLAKDIGNTSSDATHPEHVFQQVKCFVEVNQSLKDMLQEMKVKNETLKLSDKELKHIAEEIRTQALNALK